MQVCEKLEELRAAMVAENVDALIIGNSDPHNNEYVACLLYTSPSPRDQRGSRMPSSA